MIKYLSRKNNTYWYRRKIKGFGEVVFSLKTKNYNVGVLRHSYIDYQIKRLIFKGIFEIMTVKELLKDTYKNYMIKIDIISFNIFTFY